MRKGKGNDGTTAIAFVLIAIAFLPVVGVAKLCKKDPYETEEEATQRKILGWGLTIGGLILWIILAVAGS